MTANVVGTLTQFCSTHVQQHVLDPLSSTTNFVQHIVRQNCSNRTRFKAMLFSAHVIQHVADRQQMFRNTVEHVTGKICGNGNGA